MAQILTCNAENTAGLIIWTISKQCPDWPLNTSTIEEPIANRPIQITQVGVVELNQRTTPCSQSTFQMDCSDIDTMM